MPPDEGFPWDYLRKILRAGQRMAKVQNVEEILPKVILTSCMSRAQERYRRQTDLRQQRPERNT